MEVSCSTVSIWNRLTLKVAETDISVCKGHSGRTTPSFKTINEFFHWHISWQRTRGPVALHNAIRKVPFVSHELVLQVEDDKSRLGKLNIR